MSTNDHVCSNECKWPCAQQWVQKVMCATMSTFVYV